MKHTDFAKILTRYLSEFLPGQRNVSPNTIRSYRDAFKQMLKFFIDSYRLTPERITFKDITVDRIKEFLLWLEKERCVSINTRNQRLAAIHSFFDMPRVNTQTSCMKASGYLEYRLKKRIMLLFNIYPWNA